MLYCSFLILDLCTYRVILSFSRLKVSNLHCSYNITFYSVRTISTFNVINIIMEQKKKLI